MKVSRKEAPDQLACPTCGATFADSAIEAYTPGNKSEAEGAATGVDDDTAESVEVIRGGGSGPRIEGKGLDNLNLEDELGELAPLPPAESTSASSLQAPAEKSIPGPRRAEYKMPELISNVGERGWSPGTTTEKEPLKFDKEKLASTSDERLAADPEDEEGSVQVHVARKIAEWDLDDEDRDPNQMPAEGDAGRGVGGEEVKVSMMGQLAMCGIAVFVALFVGLIIYGFIQSMRKKEEIVRQRSAEELARESMSKVERDAMDKSKQTFAAAGEVIENFLSAENNDERLTFVCDAERVEPLMAAYYKRNPDADGPMSIRAPEDGWQMRPYESFLLATVIGEDFSRSPIAVELQEDGRFLVDWESFVGYSEVEWDQITELKPREPFVIRAIGTADDYYDFKYNDKDHACVKLQDISKTHTIYGYVRLDDPVFQDLAKSMPRFRPGHVTLRIAYPADGRAPNMFEITEVLASGWVVSDTDEEDAVDGEEAGAAGDEVGSGL